MSDKKFKTRLEPPFHTAVEVLSAIANGGCDVGHVPGSNRRWYNRRGPADDA
jgi:hypothetical protein